MKKGILIGIIAVLLITALSVGYFTLSEPTTQSTPFGPEAVTKLPKAPLMTVNEIYMDDSNGLIPQGSVVRVAGRITHKINPDFNMLEDLKADEALLLSNSAIFTTSAHEPNNKQHVICDFDKSLSESEMSRIEIGQKVVLEGVYLKAEGYARLVDCKIVES